MLTGKNLLRGMGRAIAIALLVAAGSAGCGEGAATRPATPPEGRSAAELQAAFEKREAISLLNAWAERLAPVLITQRYRRKAFEAGNYRRAEELDRQALRQIRPMEGWGRDARRRFMNAPESLLARAVVATGDAYSKWAATIRSDPPAGDLRRARHVAGLASRAIERHRVAYRLAHQPIPPVLEAGETSARSP